MQKRQAEMKLLTALQNVDAFEVVDVRDQALIAGTRWDALARVRVGERLLNLAIEDRKWPDVRWAEGFVGRWTDREVPGGWLPVVASSYLGPAIRRRLESAGIGWIDQHGNAHIEDEGLLIHVERTLARGAIPRPKGRLFSPAASRVAQALLERPEETHNLASLLETARIGALSTASRAVDRFEREGLVVRQRGGWSVPSARALLDAWLDASLERPAPPSRTFFSPEPPSLALRQLAAASQELRHVSYLLTGLSAAELLEPLVPAPGLDAYVFPPAFASRLADRLNWVPTEEVPTVRLFLSSNEGPRVGERPLGDHRIVGRAQLILDLMREGGRALQVADALRKAWGGL